MTKLRDWLFGDDLDGREYLIHRSKPRFVARLVDEEAGEEYDILGDTMGLGGGMVLAEFQWLDPRPPLDEVLKLLPDIRVALAAYEEKLEADIE